MEDRRAWLAMLLVGVAVFSVLIGFAIGRSGGDRGRRLKEQAPPAESVNLGLAVVDANNQGVSLVGQPADGSATGWEAISYRAGRHQRDTAGSGSVTGPLAAHTDAGFLARAVNPTADYSA